MADDPWKQQYVAFGEFIRTQRKLAKLTLRQLAAASDVSDAYLSQLERGQHAPSIRVLKSLASAFGVTPAIMLAHAGMAIDESVPIGTEMAIRADPRLTEAQKEALLGVYRGFVSDGV